MRSVQERDDEEIPAVTSDARPHARVDDDAAASPSAAPEPGTSPDDATGAAGAPRARGRVSLPLVPVLAVLLVLLLAGGGWLWATRPEPSAVTTADYVEVLQAARSGVVDFTSFDHLTLDDDIAEIRRVATGELADTSVAELEGQRDQLTSAQAVVSTEVVGAAVARAGSERGTVLLVIQSTQQSTADPRPQIVRYRIQVELQKVDDRWLLSDITGL